jgi:tetratricopeptide (TPR) repeat protein
MSELLDLAGEEPEREAAAAADSAAVALALERSRTRRGGKRDEAADSFLAAQQALIAKQMHHLDDQLRSAGLDRWFKRLRLVTQGVILAAVLAAVGGLGAVAWSAAHDRDLVIDGFSVPPDLAQQGSTGAAIATELHDRLGRLQAETKARTYAIAVREKAPEARVQIPETGVSLGEVNRLLHEWLGHETHVSGEIARLTGGPDKGALVLNIRTGGQPGVRLLAPDGDLDALLDKAAREVYLGVDPIRYASWVEQHVGQAEALAVLEKTADSGTPADRGSALNRIAILRGIEISLEERRDLLARSVALDPYKGGLNNLAVTDGSLGHAELALKEMRAALAQRQAHLPENLTPETRRSLLTTSGANLASDIGDSAGAIDVMCVQFQVSPCDVDALIRTLSKGPSVDPTGRIGAIPARLAALHDARDAERVIALIPAPRTDPVGAASTRAGALVQDANVRVVREDWAGVLKDTEAYLALGAQWPGLREPVGMLEWRAVAMAHLGDAAGARAAAEALARDCYSCVISHARVEEVLGNRAAADRLFADAARQGPSLPFAEAAWAKARLERGDAAGALKLARIAYGKSRRYADASEVWGEALLAGGDSAGADKKFAEAARLAPRWGRLHVKWGEALAREGRAADARTQFAAAARLDLTPAEQAELAAQKV